MSDDDSTRNKIALALMDRFGGMQAPSDNAGALQDALGRTAADLRVHAAQRDMLERLREPALAPVVFENPAAAQPIVDPTILQRIRGLMP